MNQTQKKELFKSIMGIFVNKTSFFFASQWNCLPMLDMTGCKAILKKGLQM